MGEILSGSRREPGMIKGRHNKRPDMTKGLPKQSIRLPWKPFVYEPRGIKII